MSIRLCLMSASTAALLAWAWSGPTHALTMQECSVKYKAAKSAGTVKGMRWNDFRKAECGTDAAAVAPAPTTPETKRARAAAPSTVGLAGNAVFPSAVSAKYSTQKAGRARMHTCLDQYKANKAGNGNGGLRWIQKGGGYYSECNKRLSQR